MVKLLLYIYIFTKIVNRAPTNDNITEREEIFLKYWDYFSKYEEEFISDITRNVCASDDQYNQFEEYGYTTADVAIDSPPQAPLSTSKQGDESYQNSGPDEPSPDLTQSSSPASEQSTYSGEVDSKFRNSEGQSNLPPLEMILTEVNQENQQWKGQSQPESQNPPSLSREKAVPEKRVTSEGPHLEKGTATKRLKKR